MNGNLTVGRLRCKGVKTHTPDRCLPGVAILAFLFWRSSVNLGGIVPLKKRRREARGEGLELLSFASGNAKTVERVIDTEKQTKM